MVEQQQQSKGVDLLSSRRNAHCCIWCSWGVRGALRGVGVTCLIMLCVSTSFARFLSSCRCVGISFLCHQTSCAPTSQKSQSSPLKSLCPSHFCFNHHQRPSQRAIFARALRPAILVCSDGAPTWWIEEASARGRRTHTRGHREALVLLRPALARALLEAEADHVTAGTVEYLARPPERTALLPVLRERCLQPHPGQLTTTAPLQRRKTTKAIMAACISLPQCLGMQQR